MLSFFNQEIMKEKNPTKKQAKENKRQTTTSVDKIAGQKKLQKQRILKY